VVDRMDSRVPPNKTSGGTMSQWQTAELTVSDVTKSPAVKPASRFCIAPRPPL